MDKLKNIKYFMLDMDGTIYLEDQLIDGALEFLEHLRLCGKKYIFLTNNSSKSPKDYMDKLTKLNINVNINQIYTSGTATIEYIKKEFPDSYVYLLGNSSLSQQFKEEGIQFYFDGVDMQKVLVVLGFDTSLDYNKLNTACDLIRQGATFIATHPDIVCPLANGRYMPDAGAISQLITACTKVEPIIIGKPSKLMIDGVINRFGYDQTCLAMVGDRLYTDIAMGNSSNIISILVLSGEAQIKDLSSTSPQPDYIFDSVKQLCLALK